MKSTKKDLTIRNTQKGLKDRRQKKINEGRGLSFDNNNNNNNNRPIFVTNTRSQISNDNKRYHILSNTSTTYINISLRKQTRNNQPVNLKIHISNDLATGNNRSNSLVIPDPAHFKDQLKEVKVQS